MNKILKICAIGLLSFFVIGCGGQNQASREPITLTYYKLFDESRSLEPVIESFEKANPNITINYRKFNDVQEYTNLILNEIAEGEGPDIFSMPNIWIQANYKKITPAPIEIIPADAFANTFLEVATKDLVLEPAESKTPLVYGVPLTVDTLALYYNKDHFERAIPEQGKPSTTWQGLYQDILKLRRVNEDKVLRAGLALGRADNLTRTVDVLYALVLQQKLDFYNNKMTKAEFASSQDFRQLIEFITGFASKDNTYYTWNADFLDPETDTDVAKFINGEISMMFGYSHLYKDLVNQIKIAERNNTNTIEATDIRIAPFPQLSTEENEQVAYANYFAETVTRTSKHPQEAWLFLRFLAKQENLVSYYTEGGFKPTSRRDLISSQRENGIYRAFVEQLGIAQSLSQADPIMYRTIFTNLITEINSLDSSNKQTKNSIVSLIKNAELAINDLISPEGVRPKSADL